MSDPPALREPIRRSIAEIAPPPRGARITYRSPMTLSPSPLPDPGLPWAVPGTLPPPAPGMHPSPAVSAGMTPLAPAVAGLPPDPASTEPIWPHWRDLLDGPPPDAERFRATYDLGSDSPEATVARAHAHGGALSSAIKAALQQRVGPEPEWPAQDRSSRPVPEALDSDVTAPSP